VTAAGSAIDAGTSVKVRAGHLTANDSTVDAGTWIDLDADAGDIVLTGTDLTAGPDVDRRTSRGSGHRPHGRHRDGRRERHPPVPAGR
jgi:hypothetical protein